MLKIRRAGDLYVSNGDSDSVSVLNGKSGQVKQTISLKPYRSAPAGSDPDALAVSKDGKMLYVASAGNNDVAVVSLSGSSAAVKGLIPTAWYPTGVYLNTQNSKLMVTNAKGLGAGPNREGQYVGNMMEGTLSMLNVPSRFELAKYTVQVKKNNAMKQADAGGTGSKVVIPRNAAEHSPIKHVIYVIKENRTYDQVFGDLGKGNGDAGLAGFGEQITPNIHKLSKQFVTLDNFYADAEISAQGHNWATAAMANDYTEKNWMANYSSRNRGYDFEGDNDAAYPQSGFLWDNAQRSGVSYRDYGEFANYDSAKKQWVPTDASIGSHFDPNYPGWDLSISDLTREAEWEKEFNTFIKNNNLPQLEIVRLPNDHTSGTKVGKLTPQAMVAQNDYAVGKLVDAISHSKYWEDTAIFITEDDSQNGWDHVDAHRTESLVVSPYTQTGKVDSVFYDTASMIHTMERILGMKPMTQFDAASIPMNRSFTAKPNNAAYKAAAPTYPLDKKNGETAPDAKSSGKLDFSREDHANETILNKALWDATLKAKKGAYPGKTK
ncbi:bifunctional YncE family protein/alkaline phosphatase family protein [Terrilactibacillus sp. S3-3]|nr:bifunctional YncE family protein/alkaline phosphatase family protein [Terrilactibacillus sp. S3-3]